MTENDLESTDVVAPAYLPPRLFLWRRHRLAYDRQARTVTWSTLRDTKVFAVPGSPACGTLPTLASIVVVDSMVTAPMVPATPSKLFVLVDDDGAALGRFTSTLPDVFDRVWPAANLNKVRAWGVDLRHLRVGSLVELNERIPGASTPAQRRRYFAKLLALGLVVAALISLVKLLVFGHA